MVGSKGEVGCVRSNRGGYAARASFSENPASLNKRSSLPILRMHAEPLIIQTRPLIMP